MLERTPREWSTSSEDGREDIATGKGDDGITVEDKEADVRDGGGRYMAERLREGVRCR